MTKPNIVILHYAGPPTIGGVEATIATHARLFADHGYPVRVIVGSGGTFDDRVPVHILPDAGSQSPRVLHLNAELRQGKVTSDFYAQTDELRQQLERVLEGKDAPIFLFAHNVLSLHKNLPLTAALRQLVDAERVRLIAWNHDFAWTDPRYADEVFAGYPWNLLRQPWPGVEYVVVSEDRRVELLKLWGEERPVRVISPGVDVLEFLDLSPSVAKWVRDFELIDAAPLLLLPARLTRRKRIEFALEVTAELGQVMKPKLVITGPPGPHNPTNVAYLESLRTLRANLGLEKSVVLLHDVGLASDADIRGLYRLADALLLPSEREGFGIPLLEAGLTRLPIFCSDIGPFHESAGEYAHYLSAEESPRAAARVIAESLSKNEAYLLKRRVAERYSWENVFLEGIEPLVNAS